MVSLVFRTHAIRRMFERGVLVEDVENVIREGEVIEDYPGDQPYPSRLILGWLGKRPLHAVVAENPKSQETIVITVYEPSLEHWRSDFKRRKDT